MVLVDVDSASVPPPTPVTAPTTLSMPAPLADPSAQRPSIDDMIQRLALEQDQRIAHDRRPSEGDQAGPSGVHERRESGGRERRESSGGGVRERRESSGRRSGGERRPSSTAPAGDHSYAVAAQHDPLSPRASKLLLHIIHSHHCLMSFPCYAGVEYVIFFFPGQCRILSSTQFFHILFYTSPSDFLDLPDGLHPSNFISFSVLIIFPRHSSHDQTIESPLPHLHTKVHHIMPSHFRFYTPTSL